MSVDYPGWKRQNCGYAIRYIKWLMDSGVAQKVGPNSIALLVAIVTKEDELHYSKSPDFYNGQLLSRTGIGSEPTLAHARRRAVEAGLLVYTEGAKRRPGTYFVTGMDEEFPKKSLVHLNDNAGIAKQFPKESLVYLDQEHDSPTDSQRIAKDSLGQTLALHTHNPIPYTLDAYFSLAAESQSKAKTKPPGKPVSKGGGVSPPPMLVDLMTMWNRLKADGLVQRGVRMDPPGGDILASFDRCQKEPYLAETLSDIEAVEQKCREATLAHNANWFTFDVLLGAKSTDRTVYKLRMLMDGRYVNRSFSRDPPTAKTSRSEMGEFEESLTS